MDFMIHSELWGLISPAGFSATPKCYRPLIAHVFIHDLDILASFLKGQGFLGKLNSSQWPDDHLGSIGLLGGPHFSSKPPQESNLCIPFSHENFVFFFPRHRCSQT